MLPEWRRRRHSNGQKMRIERRRKSKKTIETKDSWLAFSHIRFGLSSWSSEGSKNTGTKTVTFFSNFVSLKVSAVFSIFFLLRLPFFCVVINWCDCHYTPASNTFHMLALYYVQHFIMILVQLGHKKYENSTFDCNLNIDRQNS